MKPRNPNPSNRYLIITGAAGLIGSGIVRVLNDQGRHHLILVDDLKQTDKWKNLVGKQFVDLISRHKIFDWLATRENEVEAVLHLGACSDTMETNADYLLENNFRFTIRLAEWALTHNKRFIYASSAATYGDGTLGFSDDKAALLALRPINMYAFSKQLVDLWMQRENVLNRVVGLKYFNVFGPNEYHKGRMASMVLKMMHKAKTEGVIRLYKSNDPARFADGEQMRDFIYVKDAAKMTVALLDPPYDQVMGIFNIGRGVATTWNTLASALFQALGKKAHLQYIEMPPELNLQYQNYTCADMRKWNAIFGRDPALQLTPIEEAVGDYVQNYLVKEARW
ncbi:MAG: ADP-glyceromanno-heptose 6-epimerase [Chlamydiia bacterium]|nr:ADP-glyceromanno-heptose 6-epimerase [Chlamydiia bacterium]